VTIMVKATQASTIALWRNHWLANPNISSTEMRLVWASIQNEAEGTGNTAISAGSVSKYAHMFKAEALQAGVVKFKESGMESLEAIEGPFEAFDSKAELYLLQSQLVGVAVTIENVSNKVRLYGDAVTVALTLLEDAQVMDSLVERAETAERELAQMEAKVERAEAIAREERDKRISQGITHGDATGR
jgi:hypothetical protein